MIFVFRLCNNKSQPMFEWKIALALDVDVKDLLNSSKKKL